MNKKLINILLSSFLLGAFLGVLIGISVKYPTRAATLAVLTQLCQDHGGWDTTMVSITGKFYTVTCKDGVELNIQKVPVATPIDK